MTAPPAVPAVPWRAGVAGGKLFIMDIFDSPLALAVSVILGAISFVLVTAGLKSKNLTWALWGLALGVPSYAPTSPAFWAGGVMLGVLAFWVQRNT